jgi:hypothetical protein
VRPWTVVSWRPCPECDGGGLGCVGVQANGRLVRHSVGMGYVERVGPGTYHPNWTTVVCKSSGRKVSPPCLAELQQAVRDAPAAPSED